jgi:hypothetical protein
LLSSFPESRAFVHVLAATPILAAPRIPLSGYLKLYSELGLTGAAAGIVFWLIARTEMRPDDNHQI